MRAMFVTAMAIAGAPLAAQPCDPPPGLAGWDKPVPLITVSTPDEKPVPRLVVGRAAAVTLAASERMRNPPAPVHVGGAIRYAGVAVLEVPTAGTYRIALGGPAWIDVIANGRVVSSVAHGHGPECSTVRKMVDFALAPGRYVVQLSDAPGPTLTAMVVRLAR